MSIPEGLEEAATAAASLGLSEAQVRRRLDLLQLSPTERTLLRHEMTRVRAGGEGDFVRRAQFRLTGIPELENLFEQGAGPHRSDRCHQHYLRSVLESPIDWDYVLDRLRIGLVLHRLHIAPHGFLIAQGLFMSDLAARLIERPQVPVAESVESVISIVKTVLLDAQLALEAYVLRTRQHAGWDAPPAPRAAAASQLGQPPPTGTPTLTRLDAHGDGSRRRDALQLDRENLAPLSRSSAVLRDCCPLVLEEFESFLSASSEVWGGLRPDTVALLRNHTDEYWARLGSGTFDAPHVASNLRVGVMLERFDLSCEFYLSGLARQLSVLIRQACRRDADVARLVPVLLRAVMFDVSYAVDAYLDARSEAALHSQRIADELAGDLKTGVAVIDAAKRLEAANRTMLDLVGIDEGLLHRIDFSQLLPVEGLEGDLRRVLGEEAQRTSRKGSLRGKDVSVSLMRLSASPARKGERRKVAVLVEELEVVRKWVDPLERDSRSFEALVERVGATVWQADCASWTLVLISRPVEALTGEPDVAWLGKPRAWPEAIPQPDRARFLDACDRLAVGQRAQLEHGLIHRDGRPRWVQTEVRRERLSGGAEVFSGVTMDLTEKREEHLRRLEAVSQLAAGVAHEFNNLLSIILTNLSAVESTETSDQKLESVRAALSAANRGANVTQRLLALSRTQMLRPADVNVAELVRSMVVRIERMVGPGIEVRVVAPEEGWLVHVDPEALRDALLGLVENARTAMAERGGQLTLTVRQRTCSETCAGRHMTGHDVVELEVADTGIGMTDAVREHAFEPFFTTDPASSGRGLGLSVVHGFVVQSGGQVELDSQRGVGTRVHICFLRKTPGAERLPDPVTDVSPHLVLIVDDEPLLLRGLARMLQRRGYEVCVANSTASALRLLESMPVQLLLTDYDIGAGDDGLALSRAARRRSPSLPIILMSGYLSSTLQAALGDIAFLPKPFTELELLAMIRKAIARRGADA